MNIRQRGIFNESYPLEQSRIAIVLTHLEYNDIPFGHLWQLDETKLVNIYILLSEDEIQEAQNKKFKVFGDEKNILAHYQSQSDRLKFTVMNTGKATTEEEKIIFYLDNVQEHNLVNIILCKESLPWSSNKLRAQPRNFSTTKLPFFNYTVHQSMPSSLQSCSSEKELELFHRTINPCICYQVGFWDILNYQWLFNIFVELTTLKINSDENTHDLVTIIQEHNRNAINLNKAENACDKTCHKVHKTFDKPGYLLQYTHANNTKKRDDLEINSLKIINKLIQLYQDVTLKQKNRQIPIGRTMNISYNSDEPENNRSGIYTNFCSTFK